MSAFDSTASLTGHLGSAGALAHAGLPSLSQVRLSPGRGVARKTVGGRSYFQRDG